MCGDQGECMEFKMSVWRSNEYCGGQGKPTEGQDEYLCTEEDYMILPLAWMEMATILVTCQCAFSV